MANDLLQTPLHEAHLRLGARMVPFAGWEMPVQYGGTLAEVAAVRTGAGIFDVSHMARFTVEGVDARALLDWVHTADIGDAMAVGRARYGLFCNEEGGIIDDGLVYRLDGQRFLVIANASNATAVLAWLMRWRQERFAQAEVVELTRQVAMIALQGPHALRIAAAVSDFDAGAVRPFRIAECRIQGRAVWFARTGYTGEDGVEVMPDAGQADAVWELLRSHGAVPCGLAARDTLRLEAGLLLHGNDMDSTINPVEAGLERFVAWDAGDFCGADAVRLARDHGTERKLIGFRTPKRGPVPRQHAVIMDGEQRVGEVTSGGFSPSLDTNIGLGYVRRELAVPGRRLQVDVRGRSIGIETVPLPFYVRPRPP